jgi:3-oxoacyl-[acyl-carrier protein] reductase
LEGRTALITGAASGIGAATARMFASAGANVALAWYPPDGHEITDVIDDVRGIGARAIVGEVDVRQRIEIERLTQQAQAAFGSVDIVVANAGVARREPAPEQISDAQWDFILDVNLSGVRRCFQAAIPMMRERHFGRLLATTSVSGTVQAWEEHTSYAASKAGIVGVTKSLAVELGKHGITVNAVAPGLIESPQSLDEVNSLGARRLEEQGDRIPVGRVGTCDDVAGALLYLASTEAGYINGHVLVADGGRHLASS